MEDVSASKNQADKTKKDKEDMMPKTPFFSKMKRITDTNIDTVDMIRMKDKLKEGEFPFAKMRYRMQLHNTAQALTLLFQP